LEDRVFKISIVANTAWNILNFRRALILELLKNKFEVVVIAPEDKYVREIEKLGVKFIPLSNLKRKGTNPFKELVLVREFYKIYKREKIDLCLNYTIKPNIYSTIAGSLIGVKMVCTVTGLGYSFLNDNLVSRLAKYLYRIAFRRASVVIFQNDDDRELFINTKLVENEKSRIIYGSGINCQYYLPEPKISNDNKFVFLFVGRLLYDKGIIEFLESADFVINQHKNVEFWVLGAIDKDNPSALDVRELNKYIDSGVIKYFEPTDEVKDYIKNADVVVLPSYREGLPRVMLEALSMEKPVITTDVPGCRVTVENGENGILVPAKDKEALSKSMVSMLQKSKEELRIMGICGREMALKRFDDRIICQAYLNLIDELLPK
jgi:glycosyltransferase involved in cell wall biosynthesis